MTEYRYAIADSNGIVFPGTYAADRLGAQYYRIEQAMGRFRVPIDKVNGVYQVRTSVWQPFVDAGEQIVYCRMEDGVFQEIIP
jgi:hypothetical protein